MMRSIFKLGSLHEFQRSYWPGIVSTLHRHLFMRCEGIGPIYVLDLFLSTYNQIRSSKGLDRCHLALRCQVISDDSFRVISVKYKPFNRQAMHGSISSNILRYWSSLRCHPSCKEKVIMTSIGQEGKLHGIQYQPVNEHTSQQHQAQYGTRSYKFMVHGQGIYLVFYLTMLGISAICLVISHSVHGQEHYHLMLDQVLYRPYIDICS